MTSVLIYIDTEVCSWHLDGVQNEPPAKAKTGLGGAKVDKTAFESPGMTLLPGG